MTESKKPEASELTSVDDIVDAADEVRKSLGVLEGELEEKIREIRVNAIRSGRRKFSEEEKKERDKLLAIQKEVRDMHMELDYSTLILIDNSLETKHLLARMREINVDLKNELVELKRIEDFADQARKITEKVEKALKAIV